ncbi:P-loop containing nucleoside triphosphate hydrolase protein [Rhypophila decipiens]|uniref:P-loop containing nucleoside triphosphate hydrolase protein n=1 Tax=Rhypophila decipiens TaxID=261697 RepID=A0AAN6Y6K6_9PEZI|nr:P-loop containing nucleoside triphosphate hydrolase protein [Rhypophila decipiens]
MQEEETGSKPFRVCGAWVEVLPDLLAGSTNKTLLNAIEAFAVSILSGGPVPTVPLSAGLEAKTQALSSLQKALCTTGATYSDELAATVMCVLFAELFLPTSLSAWVAHLEGFMQVMQLSRPEMYTSGLSHKLFVGARPSMIVLGFFTRKAVFVAEDRWRTVPFAQQPPSPVQEVMGEGARIPGILEQIDLLEGQSHESIRVGVQRVLQELFDLLDRLNSWKASYPLISSSTSYWFKPAALGSRPSIWFDNIMIANALHHLWAFKAICLGNIERLRLTYPMLMLTDNIFAGYIEHRDVFEEVRSLSTMICQSIEYLMQDEMKLFGPTSAILPLRVAFDTFRVGGTSTAEELECSTMSSDPERELALSSFKAKLIESREWESKLKNLRLEIKGLQKDFDRTEDNIKALQSVGQIIGEVLKQLDEERFIVKASSGPRYVVGCRSKVDKAKLKQGTRVALDMTTLTIMRMLPREVDPLVYNMSLEDPGQVSFAGIGGLNDQIRELREVIELPLKNPELFLRVGIKPPKGVLLYGPPGTGKTLLARAVASSLETNFLKVVSSAIVDKYIGESARLIREMFGYAKEHEPCIIFMDEIDAIGGRRFSEGTSADREIQRTLMELLNQLDGFDYLGKTKIIMATNRPDTLDPALLRAGRLDRKIEIPLPNEVGRLEILKIHASGVVLEGDIDFESVVKMSDGLNGADLRNVITEAGLFAIKDYRDAVNQDDFNKAVRKVAEAKKLEGKLEYQKL